MCVLLLYKFIFLREMKNVQSDIENCLTSISARVVPVSLA